MSDPNNYTVGWICAIEPEYLAAQLCLDETHPNLDCHPSPSDTNTYTLGKISNHNVVIACLPDGSYGTSFATNVATNMLRSFPNVRIGVMVGIGGGAPTAQRDIRLGDVVVSSPGDGLGGVFQHDFGKRIQEQDFQATGFLNRPPKSLLTAVMSLKVEYRRRPGSLETGIECILEKEEEELREELCRPAASTDVLYRSDFIHPTNTRSLCSESCGSDPAAIVPRPARTKRPRSPVVHYGLIASGNQLMKDALRRDELAKMDILCFEMEAAGLMNDFPCLVVRGICDYSDSHKNKKWQGYAALAAAAYTKDLLSRLPPRMVEAGKKIGDILSGVQDGISTLVQWRDEAEVDKMTKWLAAPDPSTNLNKARELHQPGTGRWLLDSDKYRSWKMDRGSFLWLYGIPGCGKTILSSTVVADLDNDAATSATLLYFYFNFTDAEKRSTEKAVRSLIDQLYRKGVGTRGLLDSLYASHYESGRQPTHASLATVLQAMIGQCRDVWIVLDGLDECDSRELHATDNVISWTEKLRSQPNVHLLVTSRPEDDIKSSIEVWARTQEMVALQSSLVADDIGTYVCTKVEQMGRWRTRPDIRDLMAVTLSKRADGMFRWVACQLDILEHCLSPRDVERELAALPRTLDETYARIYERISPEYKAKAVRLLQLLIYSKRPLRIEEAVDAIAIEPTTKPRFDRRNRMPLPKEITRYCSSFVSLTYSNDAGGMTEVIKIQLAHFSVQEYFQSDRLEPPLEMQLNKTAAAAASLDLCLSYLLELNPSLPLGEAKEQYPFVEFAAQYWWDYAVVMEASNQTVRDTLKEYYASQDAFTLGCKFYSPEGFSRYEGDGRAVSPLYYTSVAGLLASVHFLLKTVVDIHAQGREYGSALVAASCRGRKEIVQVLLASGVDVVAQGEWYGNALLAACFSGHEEVVQILLQSGANVNTQGGEHGNALQAASYGGHKRTVQILLQYGADVNTQGGEHGNALQAASYGGHRGIIQILLQSGAIVNMLGGYCGNALQAASSRGWEEIVQLLLQAGANVNARGGPYGNALQAASFAGCVGIIQLLLENGANVNAQGGYYGDALQAASFRGEEQIVQILLQNGANVNARGGRYGNALQAALSGGCARIVPILLRNGARNKRKKTV